MRRLGRTFFPCKICTRPLDSHTGLVSSEHLGHKLPPIKITENDQNAKNCKSNALCKHLSKKNLSKRCRRKLLIFQHMGAWTTSAPKNQDYKTQKRRKKQSPPTVFAGQLGTIKLEEDHGWGQIVSCQSPMTKKTVTSRRSQHMRQRLADFESKCVQQGCVTISVGQAAIFEMSARAFHH